MRFLFVLATAALLERPLFAQSCPDSGHCQFPKLLAPDGAAGAQLGSATAADSGTLVIGAPDAGKAYVYARSGNQFVLQQTLTGTGEFGTAVAVAGDWLLVGARSDATLASGAGAVHVFRRSGSSWALSQTLYASNGQAFDRFGESVALAGSNALIGASGAPAAYAFRRVGNAYVPVQVLAEPSGEFGYAVALGGNYAVVGAWGDDAEGTNAGAAYVYEVGTPSWTLRQKLTASDFSGLESNADDWFGSAVAMNGNDLAIGAYGRDANGANSGAVYTYRLTLNQFPDPPTWNELDRLTGCAPAAGDNFGFSVAIDAASGGRIIAGAPLADIGGSAAGAAYVFERSGVANYHWSAEDRLLACDAQAGDHFGSSVAVSGDHPLVGAETDDDLGSNSGSAYLFSLSSSSSGSCMCPCTGIATDAEYGSGKAGTFGVPMLAASEPPVVAASAGFRLTKALPGALPLLLLGTASAGVPFDGGTLLVQPAVIQVIPIPVPINGTLTVAGAVPASASICGAALYLQVWYQDPGAAGFYHTAQTNGLTLTFGS